MAKTRSLLKYLIEYNKKQDDIMLVHRQSPEDNWSDRCLFLSDDFEPYKPYNHRSIIENEIVLEYDHDNPQINKYCAEEALKKLKADDVSYSIWDSGNKSRHIHFFIDLKNAKRRRILKSVILRHYGEMLLDGERILPDMRMSAKNGLIRAEYGKHEKSGKKKTLVRECPDYPRNSNLPETVWIKYAREVKRAVNQRLSMDSNDIVEHPYIKFILSTDFREAEDGRERALFILIHVLKPKYKDEKEKLIRFLQEWYRYSGGSKLTDWSIACKISYHWDKKYTITESFIKEFLYSLNVDSETIKKETTPNS